MQHLSRLTLLGLVALGLLVVALVAALVLRWTGAAARADELARLATQRRPALPADLPEPTDPRPEATGWFAELVAARIRWTPEELAAPESYARLRARARATELAAEAEEAFAALEGCAGTGASEALQRVVEVLAARDGIAGEPPCGAEAARLLALGTRARLDVARRAREYGAVSPRVVNGALERDGAVLPQLPILQALELADAVSLELARAIWSEQPALVPELLLAALDVARVLGSAPFLVAALGASEVESRLLAALEFALSAVPEDLDLSKIEDELAALRPRERLVRAMEGERALGNRAFELLRQGARPTWVDGGSWLPIALIAAHDQAAFLRAWREQIGRAGCAAYQREPPARPGWSDRQLAPITALLVRTDFAGAVDALEARLALARAALVARRGGAQALLEHVARSADPYDGRPLRVGFADSGVVVLWSVGADGRDDGGLDEARDVVWRFKPR
ncbi:MAG: hypothetical protein JNK02_06560 [Planctomycetes bacterium]|nr:hypothetical protein [Planctomycetota bacterium]